MQSAARLALVFAFSAVMACGSEGARGPDQEPATAVQETPDPAAVKKTPAAKPVATTTEPATTKPANASAPADSEFHLPAKQGQQPGATGSEQQRQAAVFGTLQAQPVGVIATISRPDPGTENEDYLGSRVGPSSVRVQLNVSSATGAVDSKTAASVMEKAHEHFQACGNSGAPNEPLKTGTPFKLEFRIGAKGTTSAVSLTGADNVVSKCIVKIVRNLQFPVSKKPTTVSATITLLQDDPFSGSGGLGLRGTGH